MPGFPAKSGAFDAENYWSNAKSFREAWPVHVPVLLGSPGIREPSLSHIRLWFFEPEGDGPPEKD
jgi:hypothetical protein